MKKFKLSLFIFRRDLRLNDNTALINALENSEKVIPLFILDKNQKEHDYFSNNAFEFMVNSLADLRKQIQKKGSDLLVLQGNVLEILEDLKESEGIEAIFVNKDYTPFSQRRDSLIKEFCEKNNLKFHDFDDCLINAPGTILNQQQEPYKVFTAFYRGASKKDVPKPVINKNNNYFCPSIVQTNLEDYLIKTIKQRNPDLFLRGGTSEALSLLTDLKNKKDYESHRNYVYEDATSKLSAHLKFGTISIREAYWNINNAFFFGHSLIAELYWRDFFTHIAFFFPHVFKGAFKEKYDKISWWGSEENLEAWKRGRTGFPIVDAGMRQLNKTGWMHGRTRMIVGSFLVKNLGISWREGEKYFAQKLIDYDPCVNNGNWQWTASTGCDAQPYFRIFNPWTQQQKFDPDCVYIKKWVSELKNVEKERIHTIFLHEIENYPKPIIDHKESSEFAKKIFKDATQN